MNKNEEKSLHKGKEEKRRQTIFSSQVRLTLGCTPVTIDLFKGMGIDDVIVNLIDEIDKKKTLRKKSRRFSTNISKLQQMNPLDRLRLCFRLMIYLMLATGLLQSFQSLDSCVEF